MYNVITEKIEYENNIFYLRDKYYLSDEKNEKYHSISSILRKLNWERITALRKKVPFLDWNKIFKEAAIFGKQIHSNLNSLIFNGEVDYQTEKQSNLINQFIRFFVDESLTILESEKLSINKDWKVYGFIDFIAKDKDNNLIALEIKTRNANEDDLHICLLQACSYFLLNKDIKYVYLLFLIKKNKEVYKLKKIERNSDLAKEYIKEFKKLILEKKNGK